MVLAEFGGGADALVGAGRRHADVGQHHVGLAAFDGGEQFGKVDAQLGDLDVVVCAEQLDDALADEQGVFGHHEPDHHRCRTIVRSMAVAWSRFAGLTWRQVLTFLLTLLLCVLVFCVHGAGGRSSSTQP